MITNSFYMDEEVIDRRYCSIREIGYLIVPLVFIGLTSMTSSFETMTSQTL